MPAATVAPKAAAPSPRAAAPSRPVSTRASPAAPRAAALPAFARAARTTASSPALAALPSRPDRPAAGQPMAPHVQEAIERSFQVNLSSVRLHTDGNAQRGAAQLSARAFTYGSDIFLGAGEQSADLRLMAHEAAHVVQQQTGAVRQGWSDGGGDRFEHEADRASAAVQRGERFTVHERVDGARVQRLGLGAILDWFADKANLIPGFRMFTIVLGVNPINMSRVEPSAANLLRALIEFIPGGGLITQALENTGIFDKVGEWVSKQIKTLGLIGSSIKQAILDFLDSIGWRDLLHPGDVWDRAKRIFTEPIDLIKNFVKNLVNDIIKFIKDAILVPLAKLAENTAAYPLLKAVLGHDPITGDPVPDDAEAILGALMTLAGQDEIWENAKKAHALPRLAAWFKTAKSGLVALVLQVPSMVIGAIKSLELMDLIAFPRAFVKVGKVFLGFAGKFIGWVGSTVWNLLEIVFEVVSPGALAYIKKTGSALKSILKNPLPFVGNLVKAAKLGFVNFAANIGTHLKTGLIEWLTGALTGVYIPKALTLSEMGQFALSVLGITWAQIRAKIVKALGANGETIMKGLETGFDIVVALVKGGINAAWELIKEKLTDLKDTVIDGIKGFVIDTIVTKAVPKLIAMFIPGAGFVSAIISIYGTIKAFIEKLAKIVAVVKAFVDSIVAIAAGKIEGAVERVESVLAGLLSVAIGLLAGFLGLGNISSKIIELVKKVQSTVDKALDAAVAWVVEKAKATLKGVVQAGVSTDPNERLSLAAKAAVSAARLIKGQISAPILSAALTAIKARYGLVELAPYERDSTWWVRARINPMMEVSTGVPSTILGLDGKPLSQSQPMGGGARTAEGPNYLPIIAKLSQAVDMFTIWAQRKTSPVAQQMLTGLGIARDRAQAIYEDQQKGVFLSALQPRIQALAAGLKAVQALDPDFELVSIGEMSVTIHNARRQMPHLVVRTWTMLDPALRSEYERQLHDQSDGINAMTCDQWSAGRQLFGAQGRPKIEATLRKRFGTRSGNPPGMAAPHNPDQSLAGFVDPTGGPALGAVNSHIGSQNARAVPIIDQAVNAIHPNARLTTQMNVELGLV